MRGALRQGDIVARLEGGGFAVALGPVRRLDLEIMVQLAARIQAAISPPLVDRWRADLCHLLGRLLPWRRARREQTGRALLDAAQVAADEALRHGPGAIRGFAPDMARTRADRDARRDELEAALDEGQIRAAFPAAGLHRHRRDQRVRGAGALASPRTRLISPAEFLPAIEEAGLSERLGEVMLYNALSALARWDKAGLPVPTVSVNFSAAELRNPKLPEKLKWELDRFDLDARPADGRDPGNRGGRRPTMT